MAERIFVMVNGLSPDKGKMARAVAEKVLDAPDMYLYRGSLTGADVDAEEVVVISPNNCANIPLFKPSDRYEVFHAKALPYISVDFTHPTAVNENADFYCNHKLNFVMGTTGGDRKALEERVKNSEICAVVAPNMAKQIVAFQDMMKQMAEVYHDVFKGYNLQIVESHQKGKADTSGTAKAMVEHFNKLGIPYSVKDIQMIREPETQLKMGVPENALSGHGWHTYILGSEDGSVSFKFTHNVNGRDVYANGTMDAIRFLDKKIKAGEKGKFYTMFDVLKG